MTQRDEVSRRGQAERGAAGQALEVLHAAEILANLFAQHGLRFEFGHRIQARFDFGARKLGAQNPGAEQTRAHDRDGLVDGAE